MHRAIQPLPTSPELRPGRDLAVLLEASRSQPAIEPKVQPLSEERQHILNAMLRNAPLHPGIQDRLGKVITAAVGWPGGLFRYHLARQTAQAFGAPAYQADHIACAVEFFHIASLLLDDLPEMDDSIERRGRVCPHLIYGSDMTILGALALITRAYALLGEVISTVPSERQAPAHALIEKALGTAGILNGQARDLNFSKSKTCRREIISVAIGKTAPLIDLAVSLPAQIFGAKKRTITRLRRLSIFWGLHYQGVDDFKDLLENCAESGKTAGRDEALGRPNLALLMGAAEAEDYIQGLEWLAKTCILQVVEDHAELAFLNSFHGLLRGRWEALALKS